jgi:hypothetical protein
MSHGPQRKVRQELDARIPRGARGSLQNMFRMAFYLFRVRGATFDNSVARALAEVRKNTPDFVPTVLCAQPDPRGG